MVRRRHSHRVGLAPVSRRRTFEGCGVDLLRIRKLDAIRKLPQRNQLYDFGNNFEAACRIALDDLAGAETLQLVSPFDRCFVDPLISTKHGFPVEIPDPESQTESECLGYFYLATGDIDKGFDRLEAALEDYDYNDNKRSWIAFRFLVFRHLFDGGFRLSPRLPQLLSKLGLDDASRTRVRGTLTRLSSITGVEVRSVPEQVFSAQLHPIGAELSTLR